MRRDVYVLLHLRQHVPHDFSYREDIASRSRPVGAVSFLFSVRFASFRVRVFPPTSDEGNDNANKM